MSDTIPCQRCGTPVVPHADFPPLCDECCSIRGDCCNEWEDLGEGEETEVDR